jgi:hypothetical protein
MAKKKSRVVFSPELETVRMMWETMRLAKVGFSLERINNYSDAYYIARTNLNNYVFTYMRIDVSKKDTPKNRMVFTEENGWNKIVELYNLMNDKWNTRT